MDKKLAQIFVKKQIIKVDTEVEVEHTVQEFGGSNFEKLEIPDVLKILAFLWFWDICGGKFGFPVLFCVGLHHCPAPKMPGG